MHVSYKKHNQGFTLLYAVLVTSLLLALGISIFDITIKGLNLSSAARESQFAFYAADTGAECALYWDIQQDVFNPDNDPTDIICAEQTIPSVGGEDYGTPSVFTINLSPLPYCAVVSVTKEESPRRTTVESRGYNTCDTSNPQRVERAIRATY